MDSATKKFDKRLRELLIYSGAKRENLARFVGVTMPELNRWLSGAGVPDAYQLREIVRFFGVPYEWFMDGGDGAPSAEEIAAMLGLSSETVEALLELTGSEDEGVLTVVDDAIYAVIAAINAVYDDLHAADNAAGEAVE